ncbi:DUF1109 domain-containing protein [Rhizobium sp. ICMP 5592]|uniref:NrsF family protein n=1 Tax=Rhizobium sp. ICMP 5592 TaxID=2292445 RepID=UPI001296C756|nr:DUF1109 domain-containing protein [Rhizobium sp. ICMP 5592]MQB42005.1 DUF1109 domain-containing protein [Rhizobium sp. ICMP 5592]
MKTTDDTEVMIRNLAGEAGAGQLRPTLSFERTLLLATILSFACAIVLVFATFGFQPELQATLRSAPFHHKIISMLMLAGGGILAVRHVGKPGSGAYSLAMLLPGAALLLIGAASDASSFPLMGRAGVSVPSCLMAMVLLSLAPLALIIAALRTGVTTRPAMAGAAAGILAGALGAAAYAFVCKNDGGLFVAVWYSIAIAIVMSVGAFVGKRALAW